METPGHFEKYNDLWFFICNNCGKRCLIPFQRLRNKCSSKDGQLVVDCENCGENMMSAEKFDVLIQVYASIHVKGYEPDQKEKFKKLKHVAKCILYEKKDDEHEEDIEYAFDHITQNEFYSNM